ncbi:MAG TPA: hypothetical protein VFC19_47255 [Candidatus Limnocylindrales bacterium]|nr:hypothetical protein [Candidatus Limnocylindrales bacterium]
MAGNLIAVAEGRDSLFATLDAEGIVTIWSGPGEMRSQFSADFARVSVPVPSRRLAIVAGSETASVVVGSWSQGVIAYDLAGANLWHRSDIHHVQHLRAIRSETSEHSILTVIRERGGGLILGPTGGTKYRVDKAQFLDGWPDTSLLVFDGKNVSRRSSPYSESSWKLELRTFAVLDAVVGDGALICGADGILTYLEGSGDLVWRMPVGEGRRVVSARAYPHSDEWLCLSVSNRPGGPRILRITRDGQVAASVDLPGNWIDFVCGGRFVVASSGVVAQVPDFTDAPA